MREGAKIKKIPNSRLGDLARVNPCSYYRSVFAEAAKTQTIFFRLRLCRVCSQTEERPEHETHR